MFTNCREAINCPLSSGRLYADTVSLSDSNGAIAIDEMHWSVKSNKTVHGPVTLDDRVKVIGPGQSLCVWPQRQEADAVILLLYIFIYLCNTRLT